MRGRRVFLKPNMVEYESNTAINTNPLVVAGAALAFRAAGAASVTVGEGPGHRRDMEYLVTQTGLYDHLRENRIAFIDLNQDDVADVPLRSRFTGLDSLALPVELLQSDFIVSMPKLKTHHWAGMTASMKNLFGTVPGRRLRLAEEHPAPPRHRQLDRRSERHDPPALRDRRRGGGDGGRRADHGTAAAARLRDHGQRSGGGRRHQRADDRARSDPARRI